MASCSSIGNEIKNNNRSDPSNMYNIGQNTLARLRPEKLDDAAIQTQIALIQKTCGEIDADSIAVIFHECEYHLQNTIARIKAGGSEDGGWQTAKSNNKKKTNHQVNFNESLPSGDNERSPTSAFRGGNIAYRRQEHNPYLSSSRARRGNGFSPNAHVTLNPRYPARHQSTAHKFTPSPLTMQEIPNESVEQITPTTTTSSSTDEFEFLAGATQSLTFDNSLKKISPPTSSTKRPTPSSIPQQPVAMHRTVQFSTAPIDIQFGDVQWNDSMPITVSPTKTTTVGHISNDQLPLTNLSDQSKQSDDQEYLSSNYNPQLTTKETDRILTITANNVAVPSLDGTSHLSDHLNDSSHHQQQETSVPITSFHADLLHVPTTSTPHSTEYPSTISQIADPLLVNSLQSSLSNTNHGPTGNLSAFTPYTTAGIYQSMPREYSQSASSWSPAGTTVNYKTLPAQTMTQLGTYPQQTSYQLPAQQQYVLGPYPYPTQTVYQLMAPIESWSATGFPSNLDPYASYPNYIPAYPNALQYHTNTIVPAKHNQYSSYDKEFLGHYGQTGSSNNDLSNSSQQVKDASSTSKLSATAATFSQGAPLTANSPTGAFFVNPVSYPVPTYMTSNQDRTLSYSSIDSRDNRSGAQYGGRNYYHHHQQPQPQQQQQQQQQQRLHHNSTWHAQQ